MRVPVTIVDLERWEAHGAVWRTVELSDERAVLQLCSCTGEAVDMVQSRSSELIEYVRAHRAGAHSSS